MNTKGMKFLMAVAVMAMLFVSVCLIPSSEEYDAADAILVDEASDFGTATSNQITLAVDNTYKLTADVDLGTDALFAEGVTITIDLNGFELKSSHTVYVICSSGSTLSIIDSGTDGKITSTAAHGIHLANGGALSITGIDIEAAVHGINMDSASTTTVSAENSTIKAGAFGIEAAGSGAIDLKTGTTIDAKAHGIHLSASSSNPVSFAGTSITAEQGRAIWSEGTGNITVTAGDLTAAANAIETGAGAVIVSTTGTIKGGVNGIQIGGTSTLTVTNATVEGAFFAILSNSEGVVEINSGKIKSAGMQDSQGYGGYAIAASASTTGDVTINGGEFSSEGAGIFDSAGSVAINADMELSGHVNELTVNADKTVTVPEGKVFEIKTGETATLNGTLNVNGTVNVAGQVNLNGTVNVAGTINATEDSTMTPGPNAKFRFIDDGAKIVGVDFGEPQPTGMMAMIELDPMYTLFGSKAIDLSGFPVIDYNGKSYVIFNVDFGGTGGIQIFGIQKVAVPFTGQPIDQEDVTVAGTSFNADGQTMKSITFTELPGDEDFDQNYHAGASHTYQTKISTAYNGGSQYFSVKVPYEVTQVDSEVVFSEYEETEIEGIETEAIMLEPEVKMAEGGAHAATVKAEVKYYGGDTKHDEGYYIVVKVDVKDTELFPEGLPEGAMYKDPRTEKWVELDGQILFYIGETFPEGGLKVINVDIDLDGPEGCEKEVPGTVYDDYKATTYTLTATLTENLGIELTPITKDNLEDALKYTEPRMEDLYGKLPKDLQTDIEFVVNKKEAQNEQPAALEYDVTIKGVLKYVYDYDDWDTDAKGYFLAYYIDLPEGKEWKNATVTFEKDGSTSTYNPNDQDNPKTFDGFMVVKVTKPGITQKVTIVIDDKTFIWNLKFDAFDADGKELLTFEPAATYEAVMPVDKTVLGITLDDTTDKTFYMVFMNTIKSDLTINLYYLGNKTEKEEGAVPIYTEDEIKLPFWADKDVGMYIWYASFEYQLKDVECKGGNYLIEVLGEEAATEQEEAKDVLVAKAIAVVSGQESKVDFKHVGETVLYGKNIEDIVDGKLTFTVGDFVPTSDNTGYYPVNVTGKIHYVKEYTGYSSKAYYQSGFYLPFDIFVGDVEIPTDYPNMTISLEALQGPRPFDADDLDGIFVVFIGKDSSKFPEITVKIDLDGEDFAVFKETTYVLSLAPVDGDGGVTVGNLDIILVDEANEVLTFNIPEGKYFKLPNGKDNNKKFDAWNLEKVPDTYSDESVYVVSYNDVTTEGEFKDKVVFTATYKEIEPVPPQPTKNDSAVDLAVIIGENSAKVNIYGANGLLVPEGKIIITYKTWADRNGVKYLKNETKEITVLGGTSIVNTLESFDLDNVKCFKVSYEAKNVPVTQYTAWQML